MVFFERRVEPPSPVWDGAFVRALRVRGVEPSTPPDGAFGDAGRDLVEGLALVPEGLRVPRVAVALFALGPEVERSTDEAAGVMRLPVVFFAGSWTAFGAGGAFGAGSPSHLGISPSPRAVGFWA